MVFRSVNWTGSQILGPALISCCLSIGLLHSQVFCAHAEALAWEAPPLDRSVFIQDGRTQEPVPFEKFLAALGDADVVFLGEQHTDETTHRLQLAILERLLFHRENRVVLSLEMFDRDVQPDLDRYLSNEIDEKEFLKSARPWSNYAEAYRPLVERAKQARGKVIASNFPTPLRQRLAVAGPDAWSSLTDKERAVTPRQYLPNSTAYWKRVDNAVRGHAGMMAASSDVDDRLHSTQSLWDNSMGEACADALDKYPTHMVLHVNGGFHTEYWDGTVDQFRKRKPKAKVKTVSIVPVANPASQRTSGVPAADYVAFVEARASNIDQGKRTVSIGKSLSYLFHLPETASNTKKFPLLIWLTDDGLTAEEGMELCRARFSDEVAIAVVETPNKELQFDLAIGGRWFWPATFAEDSGNLVSGIEEIWSYLLRHFPINSDRVCLAGEGTGATAVAATALQTDRMAVKAVALHPRHYAKLKDLPLPLPEYRLESAKPTRSLVALGGPSHKSWWSDELTAYANVGVTSRYVVDVTDPWQTELQQFNLLAEALAIPQHEVTAGSMEKFLVVADTPRGRHWGCLQSLWLSRQFKTPVAVVKSAPSGVVGTSISTRLTPAAAARPGVLPACPGPFGGTTVVVLPDDIPDSDVVKWQSLEQDDPLAKTSRFHRTRIVIGKGDRTLPKMLEKLRAENRRNILIIPATFYASPVWLHSLKEGVKEYEDQMTLNWMPGFGGRKNAFGNQPSEP